MFNKLFPDIYIRSIENLPLEELKEKGIQAFVFDIDNTIAPFDVDEPDDWAIGIFENLKAKGFKICLLSNNNEARIRLFNKKLGAFAYWRAGKPGIRKLKKAMQEMGTDSKSTAIVGDQVFTDIWCGHNAGMLTIMTEPLCDRDQFITKIKRPLERFVMSVYFRRQKT